GDRLIMASGAMETITAEVTGHTIRQGESLTLGIRPHALRPAEHGALRGIVDIVERLGNETIVNFRLPGEEQWLAVIAGDVTFGRGDSVGFDVTADDILIFDAKGRNVRN
ncbi:MAG: TOBE domain-containing protein, partial [Alphaproteobacteria bacterium]